jgi:transposase InsO family protein
VRRSRRRRFDDVEYATLAWVAWFNVRRLIAPLGDLPPAEFEVQYYRAQVAQTEPSGIN